MTTRSSKKNQIPAVEGVFTWPSEEPRFIASRCKTCGTVSFPKFAFCRNPKCKNKRDVEEILLSRRGKLMTFTQVHYIPPPPYVPPQNFTPFAIGEVSFPEGIAIVGQMTGCKYEDLREGMEVEMVVQKLYEDDGKEIMGWRFRPL